MIYVSIEIENGCNIDCGNWTEWSCLKSYLLFQIELVQFWITAHLISDQIALHSAHLPLFIYSCFRVWVHIHF